MGINHSKLPLPCISSSLCRLFNRIAAQPCSWPAVLLLLAIKLPKEHISASDQLQTDSRVSRRRFYSSQELLALILIRLSIFSLQSVFPLSLLYVFRYLQVQVNAAFYGRRTTTLSITPAYLTHRLHSRFTVSNRHLLTVFRGASHLLFIYCLIECVFYVFTLHKAKQLQKRIKAPPIAENQRVLFVDRCLTASFTANDDHHSLEFQQQQAQPPHIDLKPRLQHHKYSITATNTSSSFTHLSPTTGFHSLPRKWDAREFFRGWFFHVSAEEILEENVWEYIAFGLFSRELNELQAAELSEVKCIFRILMSGAVEKIRMSIEQRKKHKQKTLKLNIDTATTNQENISPQSITSQQSSDSTTSTPSPNNQLTAPTSFIATQSTSSLTTMLDVNDTTGSTLEMISTPSPSSASISFTRNNSNQVIKPGYNPSVKCMRLTIDPVLYSHRPLILYTVLGCIDVWAQLQLRMCGYQRLSVGELGYWYRPAEWRMRSSTPPSNTPPPLLFIHGIGIGLASYMPLIHSLHTCNCSSDTERDVILILLPYVSMKLQSHVPSTVEHVEAIQTMIRRHSFNRVVLAGHSYGSLIVTWCIKSIPHLLYRCILIDPVCFMLFEHDLSYNFLYRRPHSATEWIIHYYAARELYIAHTLSRHFWWHLNVLWCEDIANIGCEQQLQHHATEANKSNVVSVSESHEMPVMSLPSSRCLNTSTASTPKPEQPSQQTSNNPSSHALSLYSSSDQPCNPRCFVFLSECDDIVSSRTVYNYIQRTLHRLAKQDRAAYRKLIQVKMWKQFKHAQFIMNDSTRHDVLAVM